MAVSSAVQYVGLRLVQVRDNGRGIAAESVALAPQRHATSKLEPDARSMDRVRTLGFRGEALWAVAQAGEAGDDNLRNHLSSLRIGLAAAGLLNGRQATTHWRYTDQLRARFPRIEVIDRSEEAHV